jgi:hypothetical protein
MLRRILPMLAWGGFAFSLIVHLTTWFGQSPLESAACVWALALGVALFLLPLAITQRVRIGGEMHNPYLTALMPDWIEQVIWVIWVYALVTSLFSLYLIMTGAEDMRDTYALRCYTAVAMFFYLTPALPFWYRRSKMKQEDIERELGRR